MAANWTLTIPRHNTTHHGDGLLALLRLWMGRRAQRRSLAELDDRLLADCGLTRDQVRREIDKPFWLA